VARVQKVQRGRFLGWTGLAAGGFLSLTGPLAPRVVVAADAVGCEEGFPTFIVPPLAGGRWCRRHQRGTGPLAPKVLKVLRFDGPFRPESCGAASPQVL